ncbi:leucyl aminopeptidase family protein [Oceanibium sediminis]|uniref:leucyl aminopeptidase family protein n=1 Tax=Oceanibium sediminis TaxID=2026339 RepID=UPI000DD42220|nr:leucyl aminopeptidase family protein [Oceanibium sediminis]
MSTTFASPTDSAVPIHVLAPDVAPDPVLSPAEVAQAEAQGFTGKLGQVALLFDDKGALARVLAGWGSDRMRARQQFPAGGIAASLPEGTYRLAADCPAEALRPVALGWLLSAYRFSRYANTSPQTAMLVAPGGIEAQRLEAEARAAALTQDLINTPANDMGPDALETAVTELAKAHNADLTTITGDELLAQNFPMIHAVGRASDRAPRLMDMTWGDPSHPKVTLVGKGVCFDTGGLNLKPGASMGLMKKDMGGAATVLGLAQMIMEAKLFVRLRVLIPAVENSVSAGAFRPGDILTARNGLTVEINNTDAEGRLVLADALALADEEGPVLTVSMATLTGAARVALGPDVPPFFTDDDALASALSDSASMVADPLWRLPFVEAYEEMIEPGIADLDNAPKGGFAGAITAALFLRRFVPGTGAYLHVDCYGWTPTAKPGRPKGGASQGARAIFDLLAKRYPG